MPDLPLLLADRNEQTVVALVWTIAGALSFALFLVCQWRRWAMIFALGVVALWAATLIPELHEHFLPPAIAEELGRGYGVATYFAAAAPLICALIGLCRETRVTSPPKSGRSVAGHDRLDSYGSGRKRVESDEETGDQERRER